MTPTTVQATPDTLNSLVEFDSPFRVNADGTVTLHLPDVYAPDVDEEGEAWGPWTALDGYSGQDRYSGPVMHPSEFLGGGMARDVLATPGVYVLTIARDMFAPADEDDVAGWVLLRLDEEG